MAIRPPKPRIRRSNPFGQSLSDEAIGLIAGFLLATSSVRLLALGLGLEQWTTTWRLIDVLTAWTVWPFELVGIGVEPHLIGFLRPIDLVVGILIVVGALFLLATRTYDSRK